MGRLDASASVTLAAHRHPPVTSEVPPAAEPHSAPLSVDALLRDGDGEVFRRLVDSVRDYAIFFLAPDGRIASWNAGAERIKGYRADEIVGRHFSTFYTPEAVATGWPDEELRRATALGRFEDEGWRVRKDGSHFWANVIISPVHGAGGELLGFSKVTRDLTERRRHEEQLREREENLRLLVEGVTDHAMFLLDADGRIRTWNRGAERLTGFPAAQVLGRDTAVLYTEEDARAGRPVAELGSTRASGALRVEGWRQRAEGGRFWADIATTVVQRDNGQLRGYVQIIRDLTERRRVEQLEDEGRRIGGFIAMLSHELRNPLAPIRNAATILKRRVDTPEAQWCAGVIDRQVGHMARLVDDLLDVSRVTSGKIRLEREGLDLAALVQSAVESVRHVVQGSQHELSLSLPPAPVHVLGDATRLTQVVVNLMTNAARYTPAGGHIRLSLVDDGRLATLQVADDGMGMGETLLQRAFEPFVQGERALDRADGGLGIGLTLVRSIAELHGGAVSAASAGPGQGTTMTVTLPLAEPSAAAVPAQPEPSVPMLRRVLVVDDGRDAAESLAMLLRMHGHEVRVAYDGVQALRYAEAAPPQVVLLDIGLPGMDGYEVARRLRRLAGVAQARMIAITGYGQEQDQQAAEAAGFDGHLTKPVDPDQLLALLNG